MVLFCLLRVILAVSIRSSNLRYFTLLFHKIIIILLMIYAFRFIVLSLRYFLQIAVIIIWILLTFVKTAAVLWYCKLRLIKWILFQIIVGNWYRVFSSQVEYFKILYHIYEFFGDQLRVTVFLAQKEAIDMVFSDVYFVLFEWLFPFRSLVIYYFLFFIFGFVDYLFVFYP